MNTQDKNTLRDEDLVKEVQNHNDMYAFEILVKGINQRFIIPATDLWAMHRRHLTVPRIHL